MDDQVLFGTPQTNVTLCINYTLIKKQNKKLFKKYEKEETLDSSLEKEVGKRKSL